MGMILRIASSRIVGQGDIVGRSGYFSLNLSANSVMRGRLDARRTLKSLVADLRITNKLYNEPISKELKGFLVLLKCKCLNGTNTTLYSQNKLAEELGLSKGTISRYMNEAIERGYAKRDKKGIHLLREDIFLITSESQLAIIKNLYPEIITDEDLERGYIA